MFVFPSAQAQFSVTISQTGTAANSCSRTLTANPVGGSGNYTYLWQIVSPALSFPGSDNINPVTVSLNQTADFKVTVTDNNTSATTHTTVTVPRVLTGNFSVLIPNIFTPNGDGANDSWVVMDASITTNPINAYGYTLTIKNSSNVQVFAASGTVSANSVGILGGDITWNGRLNGTGSIVPSGYYAYSLTLQNCTKSQPYTGQVHVYYF